MADKNVFNEVPENLGFYEEALPMNWEEFKKVIENRRSIRIYKDEPIPEKVMQDCLRLTTLAPSSSNLQPWEFYWVRSPEKKEKLVEYCLSQPAAKTAPELIVCVARIDTWNRNRKWMVERLEKEKNTPPVAFAYYKKLIFLVNYQGPCSILAPLKWAITSLIGLFQVMPRFPFGKKGLMLWSVKSTALACQNLMLSLRAAGYDSCPMEGFDEVKVRKLLNLPSDALPMMVISAGKRKPECIYGPQIRFEQKHFVFEV